MKTRLVMLAVALGIVQSVAAAQEVDRRDPTKPRDGFGYSLLTPVELNRLTGEIKKTGLPMITDVRSGTPADLAGLRAGDELLSINGVDLAAESGGAMLAPPAGTRVTLRFRRNGQVAEVDLVSVRLYTPPDSLSGQQSKPPR